MELGGFNGSEDSEAEDETLFSRGRRPKRRRPTCPVNLRDVTSDSSSSSEEIEPSETPPSLIRPTPTSFNLSHNTAFPSRRSNDVPSSFTSPDIPGTNGDSSLVPSTSNTPSNSWLSSQKASGHIRQAGDKPNKGQPRTSKAQPTGRTSAASHTASQSSVTSRTSTATGKLLVPRLPSSSSSKIAANERKAALHKIMTKLQSTELANDRDWNAGSFLERTDSLAPDDPTEASANPPESSKPTAAAPQLEPEERKTSVDPSIPSMSKESLQSNPANHPVPIKPPASPPPRQPSFEVQETFPDVPPPEPSDWRQNKTLQRFLTALNSARGSVSSLYTQTVRKLTEGNAKLLPEDFVDGVDISSDETKDNWSVEDDQLDSEWLELSHTDILNVEEEEKEEVTKRLKSLRRSTKPRVAGLRRVTGFFYPLKYLVEMLPVYKALLCLGRLPFEVDVSKEIPRYKYNKTSWRYFLFVGTSVITFVTALLMIVNLTRINNATDPLTLHQTALRLEQEKYWIEATLEIVNLLFLGISSVSMLEYGGGTSIVDFLNRWSAALHIIRYDVTSGFQNIYRAFFCCYGIYAGTIVLLFFVGGEGVPTVRSSCGFNGLLILISFTEQLRFQPRFRAAEFLGLFVHLYTTLAGSLVTLVLCLHCWALDNAAKRFNERLAGCLRGVGLRDPAVDSQTYPKLFAEHLMVTSFPRQIGKVFRLALLAYLGSKMVEMTVTLFGVAEPIVNGFPETDQEFLNLTSQSSFDPQKTIPIQVVEPSWVQALKSGLYVAKTWIPWLIFMEIVQKPGSSLMRGAGLIVRNFLSHSRSSHALRFITSMEFSFSSRIAFHVNPGMQLTREFAGKFAAFSLVIFVTLIQFIPAAVSPKGIVICDHVGSCTVFYFPAKLKSRDGFRDSVAKVISEHQHPTTQGPPIQLQFPSFVLGYPPCLSTGRLARRPPTFAFKCQEESSGPVYIPTYFRTSSDGKFVQVPPTPDRSCVQSSNLTKGETLFDCFGDRVFPLDADECGNPKLPTPDATGVKKLPIIRAVRLNHEIFCCFVYSGLENQAERCNLLSTGTHRCSRKSGTPGRKMIEESIAQMWSKSSKAVVDNQLPLWTGCLCQGLEGLPVSSTACTVPPTTTTTISTTPSTPSGNLPQIDCRSKAYPSGSCSNCSDPRFFFSKHFVVTCPIQNHDDYLRPSVAFIPNGGTIGPGPLLATCSTNSPAVSLSDPYYNCYGERISTLAMTNDDCGTLRLAFPSRLNGMKKLPRISVQWIRTSPVVQFLCCWDYTEWQRVVVTCNTYPGTDLGQFCNVRTSRTQAEAVAECNQFVLDRGNVTI